MSEKPPSVTIIIAARPHQAEINAALRYKHPAGLLDIEVAHGRQPSVQCATCDSRMILDSKK